MLCDFDNPASTCPRCGYHAKRMPTFRECRPVPQKQWQPIMVGDLVEHALTSIGITKERVQRLTRTAGKPGGCGCAARQRWLNEWGVKQQRRMRQAFSAAKKLYLGD